MPWVVVHQMSNTHLFVLMALILILVMALIRVLPQWGVQQLHIDPQNEPLDNIKWVVCTVGLTWVSIYVFNHFHGWFRLTPSPW